MTDKPKDISKPKNVNNKTYWWCERANIWDTHRTEDYKYLPNSKEEKDAKSSKAKPVQVASAVQEETPPRTNDYHAVSQKAKCCGQW